MSEKQSCFVIMPFGEKPDGDGLIDFDHIYEHIIKPAIEQLDIVCIRCDEIERAGSIYHKMIERIFDDTVAVVDITTLNPNVFYELGVRHALRRNVTVLIRRQGTESPFNIGGLNVIEYDPENERGVEDARAKIGRFIAEGLKSTESDSRVHDVLSGLRVTHKSRRLPDGQRYSYRLAKAPGKKVCLITGDIRKIRGIDIWVNSENTDMQMARFSDRSISSIIRVRGSKKGLAGNIKEDLIADELQSLMDAEGVKSVPAGYVLATGSGELRASNDVKRVYHAAAVTGVPGQGYTAIPNVADCVTRALDLAESESDSSQPLKSILFQIMGSGTGGADSTSAGGILLGSAITYLELNPKSTIDEVFFMITRERTLAVWQAALAEFGDRVVPD